MEQLEHIAAVLALTMGASWASGINLYAAMAVLGFSGATGSVELPPDLQILENPLVIAAASVMYVVEFIIDKIPGLDTTWDSVHTFVRIPAGAMMASAAVGDVGAAMELSAAIMGGGLAAASHATKAGSRIIINASPEPFTNWAASITEDVAVIGGLWVALHHPWIFLGLMFLFILLMIWLLPKIWGAIKSVFGWLGRLFGVKRAPPAATAPDPPSGQDGMAMLDQLERLKGLLDSGALTQDEFDQQKQELLAQTGPRGNQDAGGQARSHEP